MCRRRRRRERRAKNDCERWYAAISSTLTGRGAACRDTRGPEEELEGKEEGEVEGKEEAEGEAEGGEEEGVEGVGALGCRRARRGREKDEKAAAAPMRRGGVDGRGVGGEVADGSGGQR